MNRRMIMYFVLFVVFSILTLYNYVTYDIRYVGKLHKDTVTVTETKYVEGKSCTTFVYRQLEIKDTIRVTSNYEDGDYVSAFNLAVDSVCISGTVNFDTNKIFNFYGLKARYPETIILKTDTLKETIYKTIEVPIIEGATSLDNIKYILYGALAGSIITLLLK